MHVILTTDEPRDRRWADQFVAHDSAGRASVVFPRAGSSADEAVRLVELAARQAGESGRVILSVGHGAVDSTGAAAWVDLAPAEAFRLDAALIANTSQQESDQNILRGTLEMAGQRSVVDFCRQVLSPTEQAAPVGLSGQDSSLATMRCEAIPAIHAREALRSNYARIGEILRQQRVAEVMFLTCRVGNATDFMYRIAHDWQIRVLAYLERIVADEEGEPEAQQAQQNRVRLYRQGFEPAPGSAASRRSETELPGSYETFEPPART